MLYPVVGRADGEGKKGGVSTAGRTSKKLALSNAGISHAVSVRGEKVAAVPEEKFEAVINEAKESNKPVTYADVEKVVARAAR